MELLSVSISHEKAPVYIREKVSFTKRKQTDILNYVKANMDSECVIVSTCNRSEFYLAGYNLKDKFIPYLVSLTGDYITDYISIYENDLCTNHLMLTAAGLKSMILGEDQILGQIKDAHNFAHENKSCGKYLNTLFRMAVTGAKDVKTNTLLSKTPVSAATISVNLCKDILGTLNRKNILIIGASGKTGSIVLKDLLSIGSINLYATSRTHNGNFNTFDGAATIDYDNRYEILDICDAVISATSSPHLTISKDNTQRAINTKKKRVFIDLAVPRDIEVYEDENTIYKNIDSLREITKTNNSLKIKEAEKAKLILKKYEDEFRIWKLFNENMGLIKRAENRFKNKDVRHYVYNLKSENNYNKFYEFITTLKENLLNEY